MLAHISVVQPLMSCRDASDIVYRAFVWRCTLTSDSVVMQSNTIGCVQPLRLSGYWCKQVHRALRWGTHAMYAQDGARTHKFCTHPELLTSQLSGFQTSSICDV